MHRKTNIGAVVSHVRRDSDSIFKVKVMVTVGFTHLGLNCQAGAATDIGISGTFCGRFSTASIIAADMSNFRRLRGLMPLRPSAAGLCGRYRGGLPLTACYTVARPVRAPGL